MTGQKHIVKPEDQDFHPEGKGLDAMICSPVFLRLRDDIDFRNKVSDLLNDGDFSRYAEGRFDRDWRYMEKGLELLSEWGDRAKAILRENDAGQATASKARPSEITG